MGSIFADKPVLTPYVPKERYIPKITKHEEGIQKRVCSYLRKHYPHVDFHSDYAAGLKLTKSQAGIRKSLQSGRGWSDMFIAYPSRGYHGLYLELKRDGIAIYVSRGPRKGKLVQDEKILLEAAFLDRMNRLGYFGRFAVGYDNAIKIIDWYLGQPNESLF
jgi:hypothetical protein